MGLNIPNLDKKNFDILIEETMSKLPSLNSEWTDYNLSDPGVTILELLAWLSDINYYRLNRITSEHKEAFLKILGLSLENKKAAKVLVTFNSSRSIQPYKNNNAILNLDSEKKIFIPKNSEIMNSDMRYITQKDLYVYPKNFDILSLYIKDFGEEKEIRKEEFYPFDKKPERDFYFLIELTHKVDHILSLYIVTSEVLQEHIKHDALEWTCYKENTNEWIDIEVEDFTNGFKHSAEIIVTLPVFSNKIKCKMKDESYYETPPFIKKILINTLLIHQEDEYKEFLGESNGYVNQHFTLTNSPIQNSLTVKVGNDIWQEVDNLLIYNSTAKVYMLNNSKIIFGDEAHGAIPRRNLDINVTYLSNEGSRGNVLQGSQWEYKDGTSIHITNAYDGYGGEDKKTFEEVISNYSNSITTPKRAVSLNDYEYLALNTPNTKISKTKAFANKLTNHVEVIAVPKSQYKEPIATKDTKEKIEQYLDKKRLLTTRVSVIDPVYEKVNISVEIFSQNQNPSFIETNVVDAIDSYLHPINGSNDSNGWSFGESLYLSKLYQVIAQVDGVETIESLKINNQTVPLYQVQSNTLIASGKHSVIVKGINPVICGGTY